MTEYWIQFFIDWLWPIVAVLIALVVSWVVKRTVKLCPSYEIHLKWHYPWTTLDRKQEDSVFKEHPQFERSQKTNVWYLDEPPIGNYFNIFWRQWWISSGDFKRIKRHTRKLQEKFNYTRARHDGKGLGSWWKIINDPDNIWLILHFKDDYRLREWCCCKQFRFVPNYSYKWKLKRLQIRNKLTGFQLIEPKECKDCLFKKVWKKKRKRKQLKKS